MTAPRRASHRNLTTAAMTAAVFALAGCGGGANGKATAGGTSTAPGGTNGAAGFSHVRPTKAQAAALSREANVRASDVPGLAPAGREQPEPASSSSPAARCGLPARGYLARIRSADFRRGSAFTTEQVGSVVEVAAGAAAARAKFRAAVHKLHSARVRGCIGRAFSQAFLAGAKGSAGAGVSVSVGRVLVTRYSPRAPRTFGLRIAVPIAVKTRTAALRTAMYIDVVGILAGPAQITLATLAFSHPVPGEGQIIAKLAARADAYVPS